MLKRVLVQVVAKLNVSKAFFRCDTRFPYLIKLLHFLISRFPLSGALITFQYKLYHINVVKNNRYSMILYYEKRCNAMLNQLRIMACILKWNKIMCLALILHFQCFEMSLFNSFLRVLIQQNEVRL